MDRMYQPDHGGGRNRPPLPAPSLSHVLGAGPGRVADAPREAARPTPSRPRRRADRQYHQVSVSGATYLELQDQAAKHGCSIGQLVTTALLPLFSAFDRDPVGTVAAHLAVAS